MKKYNFGLHSKVNDYILPTLCLDSLDFYSFSDLYLQGHRSVRKQKIACPGSQKSQIDQKEDDMFSGHVGLRSLLTLICTINV